MKIRIIGCGAMGTALAHALIKKHEISLYDRKSEKAEKLAFEIGALACQNPLENLSTDHIVLLAVKPQDLVETAKSLGKPQIALLASVLAGTSVKRLKEHFPNVPILTFMPNLAVKYGGGVVALTKTTEMEKKKGEIEDIFSPLGRLIWLDEKQINAFAALTSCGPAFVFDLMEGAVEAGVEMGFSFEESTALMKDMLASSLTLLRESGKLPSQLKEDIASPGGMTAVGLAHLEETNVTSHLTEAFIAAYKRASELS